MQFSEHELISELQGRSRDAFEILVRQYSKPVYCLAFHILSGYGTKEDMEECASDVFVEVWQKIRQFDGERGAFKTWVLMLAKYKALSYKRKLSGQKADSLEDYQAADPSDMEQQVLERETQERLMQVVHTFGDLDRELFIRRYCLGESIQELMRSFGLTRSAVDNRLLRSRKTIREVLSCE